MANAFYPENAYNAVTNHANVLPSRRGSRTNNGNYVNKNPYKATPDMNVYIGANANATNAINAARPARREPNTRRPGLPN